MRRRWVDCDIWSKRWWRELPPAQKLLWKYICDVCDNAGVWSPDWALASFQIGSEVTEYDLAAFNDKVRVLDNGKVYLTTFVQFQQGHLNTACNAHQAVLRLMKSHGLTPDDAVHPQEAEEPAKPASRSQDSNIPTVEEVIAHGDRIGATKQTCETFHSYYEGENLWLNRFGRLINWRTKLVQWRDRDRQPGPTGRKGANGSPVADRIHDQKSLEHWKAEVRRLAAEFESDEEARVPLREARAKVKELEARLFS